MTAEPAVCEVCNGFAGNHTTECPLHKSASHPEFGDLAYVVDVVHALLHRVERLETENAALRSRAEASV